MAFTSSSNLHFLTAVKLIFSEVKSDYSRYVYSYAIWAVPDEETPAEMFARGLLPARHDMSHYYMVRHVRVPLDKFTLSSENRRILRKNPEVELKLVPVGEYPYTEEKSQKFRAYADVRFGQNIMTKERLDGLFNSKVISHLLLYTHLTTGEEIGIALLYLEPKKLAYYYYAFYDLERFKHSLGMFMMTAAVNYFATEKFDFIYLGTCYSERALYKTQFKNLEFFDGLRWSNSLDQLKLMIKRDADAGASHLFDYPEFRNDFYPGSVAEIAQNTLFQLPGLT